MDKQVESCTKLAAYDWVTLLPGESPNCLCLITSLRVCNKLRQHMIGGETHTSRLCFERIWVFDHDGNKTETNGNICVCLQAMAGPAR